MSRRIGLPSMREHAFKLSRLAAEFEPAIHRAYPTDPRAIRILELARATSEMVLLIDELDREEEAKRPPLGHPSTWPGVDPNRPAPPEPPTTLPISPGTWPGGHSKG